MTDQHHDDDHDHHDHEHDHEHDHDQHHDHDHHDDATHNIGADPLRASPAAGRGGKEGDQIPEEVADAESRKGTEHPAGE